MSDLPISYDIAGPVPKTTDELRQLVIDTATALSPGIPYISAHMDTL